MIRERNRQPCLIMSAEQPDARLGSLSANLSRKGMKTHIKRGGHRYVIVVIWQEERLLLIGRRKLELLQETRVRFDGLLTTCLVRKKLGESLRFSVEYHDMLDKKVIDIGAATEYYDMLDKKVADIRAATEYHDMLDKKVADIRAATKYHDMLDKKVADIIVATEYHDMLDKKVAYIRATT